MSEVEPHGDGDQHEIEDHHHHDHHPDQQQQSYHELSDDNPIENDVAHTTDDVPTGGEKSASADSGAEEVGSPEQQVALDSGMIHALSHS